MYCDFHGAGVTERYEDAEGELARRIRLEVGPELPIVMSLDLHSNTTAAMFELTDGLCAFRTYPHVDMAATGGRAARYLLQHLLPVAQMAPQPFKARRALDFIMPMTGQCTFHEPAQGVYRELERLEQTTPTVSMISFTPGFPPADIFDCGPVVVAYAQTQDAADAAVDALTQYILAREKEFAVPFMAPQKAVSMALRSSSTHAADDGPMILADVQDNTGCGATGDTTGLLHALVDAMMDAPKANALLGVLTDAAAAEAAHTGAFGYNP